MAPYNLAGYAAMPICIPRASDMNMGVEIRERSNCVRVAHRRSNLVGGIPGLAGSFAVPSRPSLDAAMAVYSFVQSIYAYTCFNEGIQWRVGVLSLEKEPRPVFPPLCHP